jgi:hypothetical protein
MRLRLILLLLLAPLSEGQQQMTHEEEVVRTTYARMSFAGQVNEVHDLLREKRIKGRAIDRIDFQLRMQANTLQFELSGFKVGPLSEIAQVKYSELVTKPSPAIDSLAVMPGHFVYSRDGHEMKSPTVTALWIKSQDLRGQDWEQPFTQMYAKSEIGGQHTRYAAYHVHVTFQGHSRDYNAMFLFGSDPRTGEEVAFPSDTIININGGALTRFIGEDAYPETLIEGGLAAQDTTVREWLNSGQVSGPGRKTGIANCDLTNLRCGIHADDLRKLDKLKQTAFHSPLDTQIL